MCLCLVGYSFLQVNHKLDCEEKNESIARMSQLKLLKSTEALYHLSFICNR